MDGPVGDPIKVCENDLREWLDQRQQQTAAKPKKPRGRKVGDGSYAVAVLDKMKLLIEKGNAKSPAEAAKQVAKRAKGNSLPSKEDRLARRYRAAFSPGNK
jgi:hypothetical protein